MENKICLNMIVKNEAHCIERCLQSVKPYLDYWVICDTGSTDNTEEVVKKTLAGINGEFHHHPWQDFSSNRNLALKLAQAHPDHYILILDADDYLEVNNPDVFKNLQHEAYQLLIKYNLFNYYRPQLFKASLKTHYEGVLHEYLVLPPAVETPVLPDCAIIIAGGGHRSSDPQKYHRDAEVLEKALVKEPHNTRYAFYLAQSYRDAGLPAKALEHYLKRANMPGGWSEETFIALLEAAKILQTLEPENIDAIETLYLRASYASPRAEPFYYLARFHRLRQNFPKAYFYARHGLTISSPPQNPLFLEPACYTWQLLDEYSVAAYYVGYRQEFKQAVLRLIEIPDIPEPDKQRIRDNQRFF